MEKKLLLIYNPRSGKGALGAKLTEIIAVLQSGGYRIEIFATAAHGDAEERASRDIDEFSMIVAAGGDGTLNEVANGLAAAKKKIPLGYIPAGSTNDFAASLEIPNDPVRAAEIIVKGAVKRIDLGSFNRRRFVYVAAFGAFTNVAYETDQTLKNIFGHAAYILSGVKAIGEIKAYRVAVKSGERHISGNFIFGMITNSISVGGFKNITGKYVALSDGLFEVTLVREPADVIEREGIVSSLLSGNITTSLVETFQTDRIEIISEELIPWTLDGEYGGDHKKVTVRNRPGALHMCL